MTFMDKNESSLTKLILSELNRLLKEVERDTKQRNSIKKYLSEMKKAYERLDTETLNKLLLKEKKGQLLNIYPTSRETLEKLLIDVIYSELLRRKYSVYTRF